MNASFDGCDVYAVVNAFVVDEVLAVTAGTAGAAAVTKVGGASLSALAQLGLTTLLRFHGAANLMVATAAASLMGGRPRKMSRTVEASLLVYGLALVAVAVAAQRGGLWTVTGKWLAQCYSGFVSFFCAYCLITE